MNVKEIVIDWLKTHGYTGLANTSIECGCGLDDLMPCGDDCIDAECEAGYRWKCEGCPVTVDDQNDGCGENMGCTWDIKQEDYNPES